MIVSTGNLLLFSFMWHEFNYSISAHRLNQTGPKLKFSLPTVRSEVGKMMYEAHKSTALP